MIQAGTAQEETFTFGISQGFKIGEKRLTIETEGTSTIISIQDKDGVKTFEIPLSDKIVLDDIPKTLVAIKTHLSKTSANGLRNVLPIVGKV